MPDALTKLYSENAEKYQTPTVDALMSTVRSIVGSFRNVYIVFDALDECVDLPELLTLLREIHDWGLDTVHLLTTSRIKQDIEGALNHLISHRVPMDETLVSGDIRVHVSQTLARDIKLKMYSAEEKGMIESALIEGAHGM
jgi:hypothetical protein